MANQKYKFERLTPIDNMDLDVYEEAIDYVFSNSDVKNVAISGAYSAGKSSVLASYKKKHGELRFLHISLAHFKSTDQKSNAEVKESTLEGKILNQLIHQIPSEKIPQTNFRVKKTVSSKSIVTSTICAVLFLISIIHLLFFSVWKNYVSFLPVSLIKSILMPSTHPYALIVDGIIILVLLSLSVYKLIRIQREKNIFRKLNIKGNEIEIFEKSDDSYFDKYLNEVLYLFENSDADVIVFEDIPQNALASSIERRGLRIADTIKIYAQKCLQTPADFILPESANYVSLFCFLNLRNLLYLIRRIDYITIHFTYYLSNSQALNKRKRSLWLCQRLLPACRKSPATAGLFRIYMIKWFWVMKDAGTRKNGSRNRRDCRYRKSGAERPSVAKNR